MIQVIIADDHHLVRQGIRALLEKQAFISIVGEACNGQQALDLCLELTPDVLLLDINMPLLNGIEVTNRICESGIRTQVLILSMHSDLGLVRRAFISGARGYLLKDSVTEDLINGILAVSRHEHYTSPALPAWGEINKPDLDHPAPDDDQFFRLTSREREVCQLIAEGMTNQAMAHLLGISVKTVEKHRANLMEKLGVSDVASLTRKAIKHGLVLFERSE
jgi:DNA-binding NarL/FixJ family response regulator